MSAWSFYALGQPAPQGSKTRMRESSEKVKPWREAVKAAAFGAGPCLEGPIVAYMVFSVRRPPSLPKRVVHPVARPDLSKTLRATEDAITEAGLWADDARVVEYERLAKVFIDTPCGRDAWALPLPGVVVTAATLDGWEHEGDLGGMALTAVARAWAIAEGITA